MNELADALLKDIRDSLDDHKAENVVVIDLTGKSDIADYMVIASGQSSRQVATMADKLVEVAKKNGIKGVTPEGRAQADWVLFDAGDVIIHLFRPKSGNSTTSKDVECRSPEHVGTSHLLTGQRRETDRCAVGR